MPVFIRQSKGHINATMLFGGIYNSRNQLTDTLVGTHKFTCKELAQKTGLSVSQVRRAVKQLKSSGLLKEV